MCLCESESVATCLCALHALFKCFIYLHVCVLDRLICFTFQQKWSKNPVLWFSQKSSMRDIKHSLKQTSAIINFDFFSTWVFIHEHLRFTRQQRKGEAISLTPHYHFHPFHRQLDISRAISAKSSPLHIANVFMHMFFVLIWRVIPLYKNIHYN